MKKQYVKFRHIDLKIFYKAMQDAYKNADNYYYEADLLHKMRRYGHSIALSTFGIEELGKAVGYLSLMSYKFSPELLRGKKNFDPDNFISVLQSKHEKKQLYSSIFAFLSHLWLYDFLMLTNELYEKRDDELSIKDIVDRISKIQKRAQRKSKNIERWKKDLEFINQLHDKRMIGMYVEIKGIPIELSNPKKIKAKDSLKALTILEKFLDKLNYIEDVVWDDNIYQLMEENRELIFGDT
jgi:AbiV family abortive infection protein